MSIAIIATVLSALASLAAGSTVFTEAFQKLVPGFLGLKDQPQQQSYGQRLSALSDSLVKASKEVDTVLDELAQVAHKREAAVQQLEADLKRLERREKDLQQRIDHLQDVPSQWLSILQN